MIFDTFTVIALIAVASISAFVLLSSDERQSIGNKREHRISKSKLKH